jgi:methionyl-tRNA formyltransferase
MRVIFAGTPDFARVALARLHTAGYDITLVLTQPDRPAGRGLALHASSVKQFAVDHGIPVSQPRGLRLDGKYAEDAAAAQQAIEAAQADVMVVAAYGLILPQWVLAAPRLGCLNIHGSLLPRWRGAAPIHRAIEAGDAATGITIMQMDAGLDTGDMLLTGRVPIGDDATTGILHDQLATLGGELIVQALEQVTRGELKPVKQPLEDVTYAEKIDKREAQIDWSQPAEVIGRRIRAFDPAPGAASMLGGVALKVWRYEISSYSRPDYVRSGTVLAVNEGGISVACGTGALVLTELQRAGGRRLPARDFLRGFTVKPGDVFGVDAA